MLWNDGQLKRLNGLTQKLKSAFLQDLVLTDYQITPLVVLVQLLAAANMQN